MENTVHEGLEYATFAGGCFWCMEPPFNRELGSSNPRGVMCKVYKASA